MKKKLLIIILIAAAVIAAWLAFCGYQWSWGPFMKLHDFKTSALEGNGEKYSLDNAVPNADSPIEGKTVLFLGSSVTSAPPPAACPLRTISESGTAAR